MKTNPILEEIWRAKDQLATEAGYDLDVFLKQLQAWSVAHPTTGPIIHNREDLRRLASEKDALRYSSAAAKPERVRETPSPKRRKK